jgi:2,4-dienoyl-CoA reductase (NADPH2)
MYPNLFSPIEVGGFKLKNRITQAPLYVGQANEDGTFSQATIDHYAATAVSGT